MGDGNTKHTRDILVCFSHAMSRILWHLADFECCEDAEVEPMTANCKVQVMRDGNVYITELKKRIRNKALFRDDNCSLSLGQNRRYYFVFSMPEEEVREMPQKLVQQAGNIAQKLLRKLLNC